MKNVTDESSAEVEKSNLISALTERNVHIISKLEAGFHEHRTFGERLADGTTAWMGSWTFLLTQSALLFCWVSLNVIGWMQHWDPYPFILLNLGLSFQAAYATPIIMMSQNRQARLSDLRNQLDLQINLLAEQENTEMLRLLRLICEDRGIDLSLSGSEKGLEDETRPEEIVQQVEASMRKTGRVREDKS